MLKRAFSILLGTKLLLFLKQNLKEGREPSEKSAILFSMQKKALKIKMKLREIKNFHCIEINEN